FPSLSLPRQPTPTHPPLHTNSELMRERTFTGRGHGIDRSIQNRRASPLRPTRGTARAFTTSAVPTRCAREEAERGRGVPTVRRTPRGEARAGRPGGQKVDRAG